MTGVQTCALPIFSGIFEANLIASSMQLIALLPVILRNVRFRYLLDQMKEYLSFRKSHPQYNLPACPNAYYKEWVSSYEFLGLPVKSHGEYLKDYWAKVKAGEIVHKGRSYAKVKTTSAVKKAKPTTEFEDKQAFINLAKKLGIYEQFKPAFRTLFTYDELLDLVTM